MTLVLGIVAGVAIAGALALSAFRSNVTFFFDPTQVAAGQVKTGERFRLGGMVTEGSVKRSPGSLEVRFVVTDFKHQVPVSYTGVLPDLFREGTGVVAHGKMRSDGTFVADEVLAKHDEKYMPPEVARSLKRRHGEAREEALSTPTPGGAPAPAPSPSTTSTEVPVGEPALGAGPGAVSRKSPVASAMGPGESRRATSSASAAAQTATRQEPAVASATARIAAPPEAAAAAVASAAEPGAPSRQQSAASAIGPTQASRQAAVASQATANRPRQPAVGNAGTPTASGDL
jgi:cytochrome c-type biogenesis protein CcmE